MIEAKPPQALSLFDLIGREWTLDQPVKQALFNASGTALAFLRADGAVALAPVADAEDPEKRIRMELDTGRTTIRPREKPSAPLTITEPIQAVNGPGIERLGEQGFAVAGEAGDLWRVTARGQTVRQRGNGAKPITAMTPVAKTGAICIARGGELSLVQADSLDLQMKREWTASVHRMMASPDGALIAAWGEGRIVILAADTLEEKAVIPCAGDVKCLAWSPDRRWVVAGSQEKALILADIEKGEADSIAGFPGPVLSVGFSEKANALMASGAFRAVGWRCPNLPFGNHRGEPVETGKSGLTLVERIAPDPNRETCAVGYANGLVVLCPVARKEEMLLIEGRSAPVTALGFSEDGKHLAAGFADGRANIMTFPKAMFK